MILPPFRLHRPASVAEALDIAGSCDGDFDYVGGGTDLIPNYKNRLNPKGNVIALSRVAELGEIGQDEFGSTVRLARLEEDAGFMRRHPGLAEAIQSVATPLIREQATLGGNLLVETRCYYFNQSLDWRESKGYCMKAEGDVCLVVPQKEVCYAVYSGDTAAVLMALGATFTIQGFDGTREVPARDFFQPDGIRKNVLERGDLITTIALPVEASRKRAGYLKLRLRDSFDFPDGGVACALDLNGGVVKDLQIAVSAVSMTPLLFPEITEPAIGETLTPDLIEHVAGSVEAGTQPVRNVMFPPQYRKTMIGVLTRRLLNRLADGPARSS